MSKGQEDPDLASMIEEQMDLRSHNSSYSSFLSDVSRTGESVNGFEHPEAQYINNADTADMLNRELEFDSVQNRLETFTRWSVDSPIQKQDLAAAGFYFTGVNDRVVCYKCDLHLQQWKAGDDPWNEHKQFRPDCPFVLECESERDFEVTCSPVEASCNAQNSAQVSVTGHFPKHEELAYSEERRRSQHAEEVSSTGFPLYHDPQGVRYSERPKFVTQGGLGYGYHEQSFHPRPMDSEQVYRDQQVFYAGERMQHFPVEDPRCSQFQRPEYQRAETEVTKHVVVGPGSSQVHIIGSGAAIYRLNPEDKVYIQSGGPIQPQQVRAVRESTPIYTEANETGRPSFTRPRKPSQYSSQESMPGRYRPPLPSVLYSPNHTEQFGKQHGYGEKHLSEGKAIGENGSSLHQSQEENDKRMMQESLKYSSNTSCEGGVSKQTPSPQIVPPGQMYREPHSVDKKMSDENGLLQEICHKPQRYHVSHSGESSSSQPPWETNRWQAPPGRNAPPRRPTSFAAFPVKDPSLQPVQRLIRHEEERHVTSSSDLTSQHHRLTTFVDWPHDHSIHPYDLSVAGFYYLGTGDSVKCFKCGISLHNWDPEDTPWGEHLKWSPRCPMVLEHFSGRSRQREEFTPRQGVINQVRFTSPPAAYQYRRGSNDRQMPTRNGDQPIHGGWSRSEQPSVQEFSNTGRPQNLPVEQQHPQWSTQSVSNAQQEDHVTTGSQSGSTEEAGFSQDQRSCSPRGSAALEFDMERLAEMGFTQQQINDAISAQVEATGSNFSSYTELVSALLESQGRQSNQTCEQSTQQGCQSASPPPTIIIPSDVPTLHLQENQYFNGRNCMSAVTSPTTPFPEKYSLRRTFSEPGPCSPESGEESLEEKLERMQEERMCKICMDAEVSVVFLPCGHLSCCAVCATGMRLCPMCRTPIQVQVRAYLS